MDPKAYSGLEALIKKYEGILDGNPATPALDPYLCPAGYWTIGYGHVVKDAAGHQIKGRDNKAKAYAMYPHGITKTEALFLLRTDLQAYINFARRVTTKAGINDYQWAALSSFAFNLGNGSLQKSNLLKTVNNAHKDTLSNVCAGFLGWTIVNKKVNLGIVRRRVAEAILYFTGMYTCEEVIMECSHQLQEKKVDLMALIKKYGI